MAESLTVPASEFSRNFGRYQDEALAGKTIRVTSHGRMVGAYLSAQELEHFERLKRHERQIHRVGELPDDILDAIETAEYGAAPR
jgi:prevent-host-death family protein